MKVIEFGVLYAPGGQYHKVVEISDPPTADAIQYVIDHFPKIDVAAALEGRVKPGNVPSAIERVMLDGMVNQFVIFTATLKDKRGPRGEDNPAVPLSSFHTDKIWPRFDVTGAIYMGNLNLFSTIEPDVLNKKFCEAVWGIAAGTKPYVEVTKENAMSAVNESFNSAKARIKLTAEKAKQRKDNN